MGRDAGRESGGWEGGFSSYLALSNEAAEEVGEKQRDK